MYLRQHWSQASRHRGATVVLEAHAPQAVGWSTLPRYYRSFEHHEGSDPRNYQPIGGESQSVNLGRHVLGRRTGHGVGGS